MRIETFSARLNAGKANNFTYTIGGNDGLITVWKHHDSYILTWEECPSGGQFDESEYTRDERHEFLSIDQMIEYLRGQGVDPTAFTP